MRCVGFGFDVAAAIVGLVAAWWWWKASQIHADQPPGPPGIPLGPDDAAQWMPAATDLALEKTGRLNARAALWTAIAVVLGAAGNLVGAWPI